MVKLYLSLVVAEELDWPLLKNWPPTAQILLLQQKPLNQFQASQEQYILQQKR